MSQGTVPCGHCGCGHSSDSLAGHLDHRALHFTASVMGNPEYLAAVRAIPAARDERMEGLEKVNAFHAHHHAERLKRESGHGSR